RTECTYEPAMTKAFLHGRTEAVRTVQQESVEFTRTFYSDATPAQKATALRKACERHVKLTKECSQGYGQDRHLYALYCLLQRQLAGNLNPSPNDPAPVPIVSQMPKIFTDRGWETLGTSILSTSNCGNPALRLFGFGPVAADGYGIGYIIKEDMLSMYVRFTIHLLRVAAADNGVFTRCASSKHLQTRRFLDTLQAYLLDIQRLLVQLHRSANERPAPFVDHAGVLRDSKTGRPINGNVKEEDDEDDTDEYSMGGHYKTQFTNTFGERKGKLVMQATAGSLTGIGEVVLLPLDALKIKRQVNPEAFRGRGVIRIFLEEGTTLYRGWGWTMARNAPGSFALFGASAFTKDYVLGVSDYSKATWTQNFIASIAGAVASITVAAPLDVVKTRIQNANFEHKVNGFKVVSELVKNEGVSAFFKGLTPKSLIPFFANYV
ncbi:hypothetical protein H0H93_000621, partial [Arthromyces matolae]